MIPFGFMKQGATRAPNELHVDASHGLFDSVGAAVTADGASVHTWRDRTEFGNDFFHASDAPNADEPTLVTSGINGLPSLSFTVTQSMRTGNVDFSRPCTFAYVAKVTGTVLRVFQSVQNNWLLGWWNGAQDQMFADGWVNGPYGFGGGGSAPDSNAHLYSATINSSGYAKFYGNGTLIAQSTGPFTGPVGLGLNDGAYAGESSDFLIGEIWAYNSVLSDSSRVALENSLKTKWGIS